MLYCDSFKKFLKNNKVITECLVRDKSLKQLKYVLSLFDKNKDIEKATRNQYKNKANLFTEHNPIEDGVETFEEFTKKEKASK